MLKLSPDVGFAPVASHVKDSLAMSLTLTGPSRSAPVLSDLVRVRSVTLMPVLTSARAGALRPGRTRASEARAVRSASRTASARLRVLVPEIRPKGGVNSRISTPRDREYELRDRCWETEARDSAPARNPFRASGAQPG